MRLLKKLEDAFAAAAFAEAGEFDTAREMVREETMAHEKSQKDSPQGSSACNTSEQPSKA